MKTIGLSKWYWSEEKATCGQVVLKLQRDYWSAEKATRGQVVLKLQRDIISMQPFAAAAVCHSLWCHQTWLAGNLSIQFDYFLMKVLTPALALGAMLQNSWRAEGAPSRSPGQLSGMENCKEDTDHKAGDSIRLDWWSNKAKNGTPKIMKFHRDFADVQWGPALPSSPNEI